MELKLPKTLIDDVSENELKLYLAIMLYKERKISISQAAKLAGLTLSDFIYELGKHKAAFTNITEEELEEAEAEIEYDMSVNPNDEEVETKVEEPTNAIA